jgi:hypothetical protein
VKIDDEALDKIIEWLHSTNAEPGDRELIGEFIRSLGMAPGAAAGTPRSRTRT